MEYVGVNLDGLALSVLKVSEDLYFSSKLLRKLKYDLFLCLVCPEGYFGDHCMTPCECKNDNFICHAAKGCVCRHGFTGENCDEPVVLGRVTTPPNDGLGYGSIVAGIFMALILVSIIVLVILYYKRRVANLKTEIAHVQYIADPPGNFFPFTSHLQFYFYIR